jgi:hypothetical protein
MGRWLVMFDLIQDVHKRRKVILGALVAALVCFGIAYATGAYAGPAEEWLEKPFMMLIFGFIGCWVLIILAKLIMTPLLQRDEDYYRKGDDDQDV